MEGLLPAGNSQERIVLGALFGSVVCSADDMCMAHWARSHLWDSKGRGPCGATMIVTASRHGMAVRVQTADR